MVCVPKPTSTLVKRICSKIDVSEDPRYVPCKPIPGAAQSECFPLVDEKVAAEGGKRVLGWQIWQGEILVEAEFHAVWESPIGELVDITPKSMSFREILFLPDAKSKYEGKQVNNIRINLSGSSLVDEFIAVHDAVFRIENKGERALVREVLLSGAERIAHRKLTLVKPLIELMAHRGDTRKSQCPCGSGKMYRICHGREIRKLTRDF